MSVEVSLSVEVQKVCVYRASVFQKVFLLYSCLLAAIQGSSARIDNQRSHISSRAIEQVQCNHRVFSSSDRDNVFVFQIEVKGLHLSFSPKFKVHKTIYVCVNGVDEEKFSKSVEINLTPEVCLLLVQTPRVNEDCRRAKRFPIAHKFYHSNVEEQQFCLLFAQMTERIEVLLLENMGGREAVFFANKVKLHFEISLFHSVFKSLVLKTRILLSE